MVTCVYMRMYTRLGFWTSSSTCIAAISRNLRMLKLCDSIQVGWRLCRPPRSQQGSAGGAAYQVGAPGRSSPAASGLHDIAGVGQPGHSLLVDHRNSAGCAAPCSPGSHRLHWQVPFPIFGALRVVHTVRPKFMASLAMDCLHRWLAIRSKQAGFYLTCAHILHSTMKRSAPFHPV